MDWNQRVLNDDVKIKINWVYFSREDAWHAVFDYKLTVGRWIEIDELSFANSFKSQNIVQEEYAKRLRLIPPGLGSSHVGMFWASSWKF